MSISGHCTTPTANRRTMQPIITDEKPDRDDFARHAEPLRRELLAYCYRMLGSVDDAEEVVQEVYLHAWRAYDRFEGRSSLRTWLYRIAARACMKAAERGRHRPLPSSLGRGSENPYTALDLRSAALLWLQPIPDAMFVPDAGDPRWWWWPGPACGWRSSRRCNNFRRGSARC